MITAKDGQDAHVDQFPSSSPDLLAAVRDRCETAGFSAEAIRAVLGDAQSLTSADIAIAMYRLSESGRAGLEHLATLFVLERSLARAKISDAATLSALDAAVAAGLLLETDGMLRPAVRLVPHAVGDGPDVWIASDLHIMADRPDFVPGVQRPTLTLAHFTPRQSVRRAADIGTGCGLHALLLARHAGTVVATDVNPRALAYARVNAGLNGVQLDLRLGDLTDPLAGESFDLLVSNPPYVISPESEHVFRDSGEAGNNFNRRVATTLGSCLTLGGLAVVLLSWGQGSPQEPPAPLQWLANSDLDALLLLTHMEDISAAGTGWNRTSTDPPDALAERLRRWTGWYRDAGIEYLGYGALALRRTDGIAVHQAMPVSGPHGPAGNQVLRIMTAIDLCRDVDDEQLAEMPITLAPDVVLQTTLRRTEHGAAPEHLLLQEGGLGISAGIDADTLRLLSEVATRRSAAVASLLPPPAGQQQRRAAGALVRQLLTTGLAGYDPTFQ